MILNFELGISSMYVSVIGGDTGHCSEADLERAKRLGKGIAEMGAVLICGGRGGIMEAACEGVKEKGGKTIGILPGKSRGEGNEYLDHSIVTGLGMLRNSLVVLNGDIVVAFPGRYGTLSEISMALEYGKRVLGLRTWDIQGVEDFTDVCEVLDVIKEHFK